MRLAVAHVLVTSDGGQRIGRQRLAHPGIQALNGKGVPVYEHQDIARVRLLYDHGGQRVQLLLVGTFQILAVVETTPYVGVVDSVEGGEDPIVAGQVALEVAQLNVDPLRRLPMNGDDVDHRDPSLGPVEAPLSPDDPDDQSRSASYPRRTRRSPVTALKRSMCSSSK